MKNKIKYILVCLILNSVASQAQKKLEITNGQLVQTGGYLVLKETNFINNAALSASDGTVLFTGASADSIGGTSSTTFHNLSVNKSSNKLSLNQDIVVNRELSLLNGLLELRDFDLQMSSAATISNVNTNAYIETSGGGVLIQEVSTDDVLFPLGNDTYTPITLNNSGTIDNYEVRAEAVVYLDGTNGLEVTEEIVNVTWFVEEGTEGGSIVSMSPQWNAVNELSNFDRTQAFLAQYENGFWMENVVQSAAGDDPYRITQTGITSFSPFTVSSDITVLPVELLFFEGKAIEDYTQLSWTTSSEINNDRFEIEWSTNGKSFKSIGQVKGKGYTLEEQQYKFMHLTPTLGVNYYRLKQIDYDGSFTHSNIITVYFDDKSVSYIYPNPTKEHLYITSAQNQPYELYNFKGQLLQTGSTADQPISLTHLPNGIYWFRVAQQHWKIIKQ